MTRLKDETRPDTRPIPVADRWAGAELRLSTLTNSIIVDQRTDQWTGGQSLLYKSRFSATKNKP